MTVCDCVPPCDQLLQTYCDPAGPDWGEAVSRVCDDPTIQLKVCGAV